MRRDSRCSKKSTHLTEVECMNSYYTEGELSGLGLKHVGKGVRLSRKVSLYGT